MVVSLLDLADETLSQIFLALGSGSLRDKFASVSHGHRVHYDGASDGDAQSLGNCNARLHAIYRASVTTLVFENVYSAADCARIWSRFPRLREFTFEEIGSRGGSPALDPMAFPACLMRAGVKSLLFASGTVTLERLKVILDSFDGLEQLFLCGSVPMKKNASDYTDDDCCLSLHRHAATLAMLELESLSMNPDSTLCFNEVDFRWFQFSDLGALTSLNCSDSFYLFNGVSQIAALSNLESLVLQYVELEDSDIEAILPALGKLRSLDLDGCAALTHRAMFWFPKHLDHLNVSHTKILSAPVKGSEDAAESLSPSSRAQAGGGRVKELIAEGLNGLDLGAIDIFLRLFSGSSLLHLNLKNTYSRTLGRDLVHILSKTPRLRSLNIQFASVLDDRLYEALAGLSCLCELHVGDSDCESELFVIWSLANGPCRHSLRLLDLSTARFSCSVEDISESRRIMSGRFDSCDVIWPS